MTHFDNIVIDGPIEPDVTVVMTIYNTPVRKLVPAISSIINQDYIKIAFVIIDDCSKDENRDEIYKKCDELSKIFERLHPGLPFFADFSLTVNMGHSYCRNLGVKRAHDIYKSEYIYFIDSDDECLKDSISTLMRPFNDKPDLDISIGNYTRDSVVWYNKAPYDPGAGMNYLTNIEALSHLCAPYMLPGYRVKDDLLPIPLRATWNKIFRTSLFYKWGSDERDICFPEGRCRDDNFTAHRLLYKARNIAFNTKIMYFYRPGGLLADNKLYFGRDLSDAHADRVEFLEKIFNEYGYVDKYDFVEKSILALTIFNEKIIYLWTLVKSIEATGTGVDDKKILYKQFVDFFGKNEYDVMIYKPEFVGFLVEFKEKNENLG